jgi:DNA (cytosine-5)-methyltransferase 1
MSDSETSVTDCPYPDHPDHEYVPCPRARCTGVLDYDGSCTADCGSSWRPRLLDLFCCAGGAAKGYQRAGFEVFGVDIAPQPRYVGDHFLQGDAIRKGIALLSTGTVAAIHASPPCQAHSDLQKQSKRHYEDFIEPTRVLCQYSGLPYIIENVEGAPLIDPVTLCGTMFPGLRVIRHRLFESNIALTTPPHGTHPLVFTHDKRKAHYGQLDQNTSFVQVTGGGNCSIANARDAMGIDWMTKHELNEALPPAYTEWLGRQLMTAVLERQVAA